MKQSKSAFHSDPRNFSINLSIEKTRTVFKENMVEVFSFRIGLVLLILVFKSDADCKASFAYKRLYKTYANATLSGGGVLSTFTAKDQDHCENECFVTKKDNCYKYNYNNVTMLCGLLYRGRTGYFRILESVNSIVATRKCRGKDCYKSTQCFLHGNSDTTCLCPPPLNITSCTNDGWLKINDQSVCFSAKNNGFGRVSVPYDGKITGLKLKYRSGGIKTNDGAAPEGHWGTTGIRIETAVTDQANNTISPPADYTFLDRNTTYLLEDFTNTSPEISLPKFTLYVRNQNVRELRIWILEDLYSVDEENNTGETCADVYLKYDY